ncbi:hypothetical protein LSH36_265g03022 [Paralvinella palmiformis]|uniref:Uncharacterized protein n=1 Tax=Paralvinella palmiformis TaxID=53620 RepID=A0AAD9JKY0_9ANNE|nr:hypothetical protein LSH36_265g03022 [Paralvinella palmiformis]
MAVKEVLDIFANHTTMHGLPKVIHAKSTLSRIFWSIVCIAAGAMFCMQMSEVLRRYFSYPKKVTVEVVPTPVPFPAISLCNMRNLDFYTLNTLNRKFIADPYPTSHLNDSNPFIRSYMLLVARYGAMWYEYQDVYPHVFQEVFSRTTFSSNINESIISEAAVLLDEFIVNCYHAGNSCNRSRDFDKFFDPYYFNCFTYTSPSYRDENQEYSLSEGIENGWSSIVLTGSGMLDSNSEVRILPGLHESKSAVAASEGVRVVIHPPGTQPFPFTEGYDVPPGFSASFGIRPRLNIRIGQPYGNCSNANPFKGAAPKYRGLSCQKMCLQQYVISRCNCFDVTLPSLWEMKVPPCRRSDIIPDECMDHVTQGCLDILMKLYDNIQCSRKARNIVNRNTTLVSQCSCFPPCEEIMYDVSYSLAKWPASGYEGDAAFHEVFYIENFTERFIDTPKYNIVTAYFIDANRETTMRDFARLNVYIADSNVIKTQETPEYGSNQLVSDIGGQLGLWVGISVITLTEVLELMGELFRYFCRTKMTPQRRTPVHVSAEMKNGRCRSPVDTFTYTDPREESLEGMLSFYPDMNSNR